VERLCANLLQMHACLGDNGALDYPSALFIWQGLEEHLERLLLDGLLYIKRFEPAVGSRQLLENVRVLKRCLALLGQSSTTATLDRVASFYQLTRLSVNV
jgi:hypothetical protein